MDFKKKIVKKAKTHFDVDIYIGIISVSLWFLSSLATFYYGSSFFGTTLLIFGVINSFLLHEKIKDSNHIEKEQLRTNTDSISKEEEAKLKEKEELLSIQFFQKEK